MKQEKSDIKLKTVSEYDYLFLYELLSQRDTKVNISHKKMPTFQEHVKFVKSKPYEKWYIIKNCQEKIGSIYLTKQNEVGIFLKKQNQKEGIGSSALILLIQSNPRSRYLANVNPKNIKSIKFFEKHDFKLIQYTYELIIPKEK